MRADGRERPDDRGLRPQRWRRHPGGPPPRAHPWRACGCPPRQPRSMPEACGLRPVGRRPSQYLQATVDRGLVSSSISPPWPGGPTGGGERGEHGAKGYNACSQGHLSDSRRQCDEARRVADSGAPARNVAHDVQRRRIRNRSRCSVASRRSVRFAAGGPSRSGARYPRSARAVRGGCVRTGCEDRAAPLRTRRVRRGSVPVVS
jgi:hypothetical protein